MPPLSNHVVGCRRLARGVCVLVLAVVTWTTSADEVALRAPLTTVVAVPAASGPAGMALEAVIVVPAAAPADLGATMFVTDADGRWFSVRGAVALPTGTHRFSLAIPNDAPLVEEHGGGRWNAAVAARAARVGVALWSATASRTTVSVSLVAKARAATAAIPHRLLDVETAASSVQVGERWSMTVRPDPFPCDPFTSSVFRLDGIIRGDFDEERIPGFAIEPMRLADRGDLEEATPAGAMRYEIRFRPRHPGTCRVTLETRWADASTTSAVVRGFTVMGTARDDYVHRDVGDGRFLSVDGRWYWPIGLNLHSLSDIRSQERLGTRPTPNRGAVGYRERMGRFAAAGGDAVEIWMSPWNLALEWSHDRPAFGGIGWYQQANAARLDRILDDAWRSGVRVLLVLANHGQASARVDSDWTASPWNRANGGPLDRPIQLFTDQRARIGQEDLRRYLVARYADHPALLAWKLWSEIDLTAAGAAGSVALPPRLARRRGNGEPTTAVTMEEPDPDIGQRHEALVRWHEAAAAHLKTIDIYRHPVTTHWSSDFRAVDQGVASIDGISCLCLDAYRDSSPSPAFESLVALLFATTGPPPGLRALAKPMLVTECGGTSQAASLAVLDADHRTAPWAALACGHAGAPMLWWCEWVDQGDRWQPYRSISRFMQGVDLRGGHSVSLALTGDGIFAQAWVADRICVGYLCDHSWAATGRATVNHEAAAVELPALPPDWRTIIWWDCDAGREMTRGPLARPTIAPPFSTHIAFKVQRD